MVSRKKQAANGRAEQENAPRPYVFVDILFEDGLLFLALENNGERPAFGVKVDWKPGMRGLGGLQESSALPLFTDLPFLAPGRRIQTFLDESQAYFQREEPTRLKAQVSYRDEKRRRYQLTIEFNLEIYRDLVYLPPSKKSENSRNPEA